VLVMARHCGRPQRAGTFARPVESIISPNRVTRVKDESASFRKLLMQRPRQVLFLTDPSTGTYLYVDGFRICTL
jgi:hypothetical protein